MVRTRAPAPTLLECETVESSAMTKDLAVLIGPERPWLTAEEFLGTIAANLDKAIAK